MIAIWIFLAVPWGPSGTGYIFTWLPWVLFAGLAAVALLELVDHLRESARHRRDEAPTDPGESRLRLQDQNTELRRRHHHNLRPEPRSLSEGRALELPRAAD